MGEEGDELISVPLAEGGSSREDSEGKLFEGVKRSQV